MVEPSLEQIEAKYSGKARILRVNTDVNPELMEQYSVRGLPTVMLFVNGDLRHTALGVRSRQEYQQLLEDALSAAPEGSEPTDSQPLALAAAAAE